MLKFRRQQRNLQIFSLFVYISVPPKPQYLHFTWFTARKETTNLFIALEVMTMTAMDVKIDVDVTPTPLKKPTPSSSASMFHRKYKWLVPFFLCLFLAATFSHLTEAEAIKKGFLAEDVTVKYTSSGGGGSGIVSASSTGKKKKPGLSSATESQNPLVNFPKMLLAFQQKRQEWFDELEKDYGKDFAKVLLDHGRTAIRPPNEDSAIRPVNETVPLYSNNRMRRKMMIKLLEAQEAALRQRSKRMGSTETHEFPKFVWASGGHRYATRDASLRILQLLLSHSHKYMQLHTHLHSLSLSPSHSYSYSHSSTTFI